MFLLSVRRHDDDSEGRRVEEWRVDQWRDKKWDLILSRRALSSSHHVIIHWRAALARRG
jgi:hypothetical protein